jgi:hypothetical protein
MVFKRVKFARKRTGLNKYGGIRWSRNSRRSTSAKRSAKIRRAAAKRKPASRAYVDKGVKFALTNKKNHTITTTHSYRLDQDLSFRNAYYPLGTNNQNTVTDSPGVGLGAAIPWRENVRLGSGLHSGIHHANTTSSAHSYYKDVVGKGIKLHKISLKGHVFIDPKDYYSQIGQEQVPYLDVYIFMVIDKSQKNTPFGYAPNHIFQNTRAKLDDFLIDKSAKWDTTAGYDVNATGLIDFNGHYMQTMMPVNTKRYKILKMTKFRMNPGQVIKSGQYTLNAAYSGLSAGLSFPGRPSYANSTGFDQPFQMDYYAKGKKLRYDHHYRPVQHASHLRPNAQTQDMNDGDNHYFYEEGKQDDQVMTDIATGVKHFDPDLSESNNLLDSPHNFNPMVVACYARGNVVTSSAHHGATGLCKIEYTSEVTYENPMHD